MYQVLSLALEGVFGVSGPSDPGIILYQVWNKSTVRSVTQIVLDSFHNIVDGKVQRNVQASAESCV